MLTNTELPVMSLSVSISNHSVNARYKGNDVNSKLLREAAIVFTRLWKILEYYKLPCNQAP